MKVQEPQGGSVVAISSISALVGGELQWYSPTFVEAPLLTVKIYSHYTPTKAGVLSLMKSCAVALGKYNIRCNAVMPGTIATDINKGDLSDPKKREYMETRTALGRLGGKSVNDRFYVYDYAHCFYLAPDDIAGPVVFLASDLAKYVTGAGLLVDGGLFVNLQ